MPTQPTQETYTWHGMREFMRKYNDDHGYKTKGTKTHIYAVAVISQDSFKKQYSEQQRSYRFSNDNKAFLPEQISNSVFGDCLDGTDPGVRLDWYIPKDWKVDYCYIDYSYSKERSDGEK